MAIPKENLVIWGQTAIVEESESPMIASGPDKATGKAELRS
jgi:hypothetical protein